MHARKVIVAVLVGVVAVALFAWLRLKPDALRDTPPRDAKKGAAAVEDVVPVDPSPPAAAPADSSPVEDELPVDPPDPTPSPVEQRVPVERAAPPDPEPAPPPRAVEVPSVGRTDSGSGSAVARAVFTRGVSGREPVDTVTALGRSARKVYFFTDIRNYTGDAVIHRWVYRGRTMAEVRLSIGGPRWRTWSSKNLLPEWAGRWSVEVVDTAGTVLLTRGFAYAPEDS